MRKFLTIITLIAIIAFSIGKAAAGGPIFWRVNTRAEIEKGDAKGISISDSGAITLAPSMLEVFDTKQAYIWSAVADKSGNIYLGTGNEGRIFKVDQGGKGSLLYKSSELSVMAMAVDGQGYLYAGTSPDGKVYRIAPNGDAKVFFEPKSKYIWALAFDPQGRLLVATGDKGTIYRVGPDGAGTILVKTTQTNITSLAVDATGNIFAGADPGGIILRISPAGKAFTLFDSAQREVRDIQIGRNGDLYVLALSDAAGSAGSNASPASASSSSPPVIGADEGVTVTISDLQVVDAQPSSGMITSSGASTGSAKSVVYKIEPSGAGDVLWESRDAVAFALSLGEDNRILLGTGQKGRIYQVAAGQGPLLLAQTSEGQTSRFVRSGNQLFAAASNLGKLFRIGSEAGNEGTYTSTVRDAQTTANWGRLNWIGDGPMEFQTRSGNTSVPDSTWSDWSAPLTGADGDQIKSPQSRYLQWRALLKRTAKSSSPRLREVIVSYLPRNLAPQITSLSVLPAGVALQSAVQAMQSESIPDPIAAEAIASANIGTIPPRRVYQRGALSLQWQAEDRNGDSLEYSIFYRNAAGSDFYPIKTGLKDNFFTLDPNSLPDGRYVFKVSASDGLSNPSALALSDDHETEPVEIDNTPPQVTADPPRLTGNSVEVLFRVVDSTSIIRRAEFQVDGGSWKSLFPVDGIADSKKEDFKVTVTLADSRPHVIAVRVYDSNGNVGSAQAGANIR